MTWQYDRLKQLEEHVPEVWTFKSVLYIGANEKRFHFKDKLKKHFNIVDVLEIDAGDCDYLRTLPWIRNVFCENVINIADLVNEKYDVIFWSHGPETIKKEQFQKLIFELFDICDKLCIMMCPWGAYNYNSKKFLKKQKYPNISAFYDDDFRKIGFEVSCLGEKNMNGSNILAWKRCND